MDEKNIQTRFQAIGFMLYNLKIKINNLDFKLKTFMPSNFFSTKIVSINLNISKTVRNAIQSSIKLKFKIIIYQNDSLN